ncbi:MAG: TonB family protein [Chakrabartia sp.]
MAYADIDQKRPFNGLGFGAAMMMSGGMVALILLAAPKFIPGQIEHIIDIYPISQKPIPIDPVPKDKATSPDKQKVHADPTAEITIRTNPLEGIKIAGGDPFPTGPVEPLGGGTEEFIRHVPVRVGPLVDNRYVGALQPTYPPSLQRQEVEGAVTVRVLIGKDGHVKAIEALRSSHDEFFEATRRQALSKWRFKPATEDGVPVEGWREMTVRFTITA